MEPATSESLPVNRDAQSESNSRYRYVAYVLLAVATLLLFWRATQTWDLNNDDAYITLTYAKNLAAGNGFVYNAPPPGLGTTSPLLALTAGALGWLLPFDVARMACLYTAALLAISAWLIMRFRNVFELTLLQALFIALLWIHSRFAYLGSEVCLFLFLLLLTLLLDTYKWRFAAGICCGLLFLARGEGALLGPLLVLRAFLEMRGTRDDWFKAWFMDSAKLTAGAGIVVLAWALYAVPLFGTIFPNTLGAKMKHGRLPGMPLFPEGLWRAMIDEWGTEFTPRHWWLAWLRIGYWILAAAGLLVLIRSRVLKWHVAWVLLFFVAYAALRVPAAVWWYRIPIYWIWLAAMGAGLALMWQWRPRRSSLTAVWKVARAVMTFVIICGTAIVEVIVALTFQGDPRATPYLAAAQWLNQRVAPQDILATHEVGYLGYYTSMKIIDLAGLTTPEIRDEVKLVEEDHDIFRRYAPQYYLYAPREPVEQMPQLRNIGGWRYAKVWQMTKEETGNGEAYVIFSKLPAQPPSR